MTYYSTAATSYAVSSHNCYSSTAVFLSGSSLTALTTVSRSSDSHPRVSVSVAPSQLCLGYVSLPFPTPSMLSFLVSLGTCLFPYPPTSSTARSEFKK
jgi:hypothetical protein